MTTKGKRGKPGSMPGTVGRAMKRAGVIRDGVPRTFLGEFTAEPEDRAVDPEQEAEVRQVVEDLPGDDVRQKARDVKFLSLIAPGEGQMSLTAAWRKMHPTASMRSAAEASSRRYREIRKAIGDKGVLALWGVHVGSIAKTLSDAQRAMFVRQFITRSGSVVTAPALVDHNVRLQAATLAMKMLGKGREPEEATRPVIVNVISYLPPNAAPWPGGGRADAGGILRPTIGPGSPAALALPAAKEERDA
jgi:hypothetical protein